MKRLVLFLAIIIACHTMAQESITTLSSKQIDAILTAATDGALLFKHEGKLYLVSLSDFDMYDIYTGDLRFRNYSDKKKKPKRISRQWDLMLLTRRVKYAILQ